jgi:hypothetical protein
VEAESEVVLSHANPTKPALHSHWYPPFFPLDTHFPLPLQLSSIGHNLLVVPLGILESYFSTIVQPSLFIVSEDGWEAVCGLEAKFYISVKDWSLVIS